MANNANVNQTSQELLDAILMVESCSFLRESGLSRKTTLTPPTCTCSRNLNDVHQSTPSVSTNVTNQRRARCKRKIMFSDTECQGSWTKIFPVRTKIKNIFRHVGFFVVQ